MISIKKNIVVRPNFTLSCINAICIYKVENIFFTGTIFF